jgi:hypothetical protein
VGLGDESRPADTYREAETRPASIGLSRPQMPALKDAALHSNRKSIAKRPYPDGKRFSPSDVVKLLGNSAIW